MVINFQHNKINNNKRKYHTITQYIMLNNNTWSNKSNPQHSTKNLGINRVNNNKHNTRM